MAINATITSWTDQSMDWSDPNPLEGKYWEALRLAFYERLLVKAPNVTYIPDLFLTPFWDINFSDLTARMEIIAVLKEALLYLLNDVSPVTESDYRPYKRSNGWVDTSTDISGKWDANDRDNFILLSNLAEKLAITESLDISEFQLLEQSKEYMIYLYNIINKLVWWFDSDYVVGLDTRIEKQGIEKNRSSFTDDEGVRYSQDTKSYDGVVNGNWASVLTDLGNITLGDWNDPNRRDYGPGYFFGADNFLFGSWYQEQGPIALQIRQYYAYANPWQFDYELNIYEQGVGTFLGIGSTSLAVFIHRYYFYNQWDLVQSYSTIPSTFTVTFPTTNAFNQSDVLEEPYWTGDAGVWYCRWNLATVKKFNKIGGFNFKL